jgi:hypothetical protein
VDVTAQLALPGLGPCPACGAPMGDHLGGVRAPEDLDVRRRAVETVTVTGGRL